VKQEGALSLGHQEIAALLSLDERITVLEQGVGPGPLCIQSLLKCWLAQNPAARNGMK
jgi:hypothetical protein